MKLVDTLYETRRHIRNVDKEQLFSAKFVAIVIKLILSSKVAKY